MDRIKYVKSPDNWHPNFDGGAVKVTIHRDRKTSSNDWRVSVWGDDDFGMEKTSLTIDEAFDIFRKINHGVTKKSLLRNGFILA